MSMSRVDTHFTGVFRDWTIIIRNPHGVRFDVSVRDNQGNSGIGLYKLTNHSDHAAAPYNNYVITPGQIESRLGSLKPGYMCEAFTFPLHSDVHIPWCQNFDTLAYVVESVNVHAKEVELYAKLFNK